MNQSLFTNEARRLFVGHPFNINYDLAHVWTSDHWKHKAGGLPRGCFLLAFYAGTDPDHPDNANHHEILLLRALEPIRLPSDDHNVASMIEYYKENHPDNQPTDAGLAEDRLDPYTRFEFSLSGLACRVLGSFYKASGQVEFGADVENFFAPNNYKVYKASGRVLKEIVNQRDGDLDNDKSEFKIGTVRYSSSRRLQNNGNSDEKVDVNVSANNFLGKRTALFGMTRTGKSNTVKKIIEATSRISTQAHHKPTNEENDLTDPLDSSSGLPAFPVGQIIFDVNGEYANENLQDAGTAIYKMYEENTVRYSLIKKDGFKEMKINFYKELSAGFDLIRETLAARAAITPEA